MDKVTYYVRKPAGSEILGTYDIAEICEQLRSGRLTRDWEAIQANGQSYGQLRRATGWSRIGVLVSDDDRNYEHSKSLPSASFSCVSCGVRMRVPLQEATCRCPRCHTRYTVQKVSESPLAFFLVPELDQVGSQQSRPSRRACPPKVNTALSVFGLDETATIVDVRQAYRDLVKSYHPDKVAHLGVDLRRVAEVKTKEINSAFTVLENFYAD